jgi:hypothetical protein
MMLRLGRAVAAAAAAAAAPQPASASSRELPAAPTVVNPEPFVAEMIAVAGWMAESAEVWSAVETARTSRQHSPRALLEDGL